MGYGAATASDPTLSETERSNGADLAYYGSASFQTAMDVYGVAQAINASMPKPVSQSATTPMGKSIESLQAGDSWWKLSSVHAEPATGQAYAGGTSNQEVFENTQTAEILIRHRIVRGDIILHEDFRPYAK